MNRKNHAKHTVIIALTLVLSMILTSVSAFALGDDSAVSLKDKYGINQNENDKKDEKSTVANYVDVARSNAKNGYADYDGQDVVINSVNYSKSSSETTVKVINGKDVPVLVWEDDVEWIEWIVDVPKNALYQINIEAYCFDDLGSDTTRELLIDSTVPFNESSNIVFRWNWKDSSEVEKNNIGDELSPSQMLVKKWKTFELVDRDGVYSTPFKYYLTQGKHTLRMKNIDKTMAISNISFVAPKVSKSYADVKNEYDKKGYKSAKQPVHFEAEKNVIDKNNNAIKYIANDDPGSFPYEYGYKRINSLGDSQWSKGGQGVSWSFEVNESGLYKIGMRVGQWYNSGQASYRRIAIDGEVPFKEFEAYKFTHDKDWRYEYLGGDEPYYIFLEAGKTHTLTMSVVLGDYGLITSELFKSATNLSDLLLKITMITGPNPDINYEYELEKQIPDLLTNLSNIEESLQDSIAKLTTLSGSTTPAISSLKQSASQIKSVIEKPETIARRIENLNNCQANIVTWYTNIKSQPLIIDYFEIMPTDAQTPNVTSGFWTKFMATFRNFLVSFTKDYDSIGGTTDSVKKTIKVFTTLGNERGEILKLMADKSFTKNTGVELNLKIVPPGQVNAGQVNALMLSLVSGNGPDVAIGVDPTSPTEFAFRDAALDISKLDGFDDMKKDFTKTAFDSVTFRNGVYGVPESMDFRVLMYRTDIADKISLKIPNTWEELYDQTLPTLYQNKLNFYMPQEYGIFLYQNAGKYYNADGMKSALDSPEAYIAFKEMIDLYTSYGVPYQASFFNRFRSGEIPMGVITFADYLQISVAAPELAGKWAIAPLPGHVQSDGKINRSFTKSIKTVGMVFSGSNNQKQAWDFLKWWVSTDTQADYGFQVESYLGPEAKWNSANVNAYERMPWNKKDLKVISSMWQDAVEVEPVLGGYFTDRHFNNAWNRIIVQSNSSITMRDSLEMAVEDINKELTKKQKEYEHLLK